MIPRGRPYDMPRLFDALLLQRKEAIVFPLKEYWLDIGRLDDFIRANDEFEREFPGTARDR
jgi:NDP-sugar pyrophosphorylase family protein